MAIEFFPQLHLVKKHENSVVLGSCFSFPSVCLSESYCSSLGVNLFPLGCGLHTHTVKRTSFFLQTVVIVDTRSDIGGTGVVPHRGAIGEESRRVMVPQGTQQHE